MPSSIVDEWRRLVGSEAGRQVEFDDVHPLRIFFGSDQRGRPLLFVISVTKPGLVGLSDAVEIQRAVRTIDGRWTLSMTLRDQRFEDAFMRLGEDIIQSSERGANEGNALRIIVDTVDRWRSLFAYGPSTRLRRHEIRGLVAEIWFGYHHLMSSYPPAAVIDSWNGPFGGVRDYTMPNGVSFEVKSVYPDAACVRISSAEQLDPIVGEAQLAVVAMTDTESAQSTSISLASLSRFVLERLAGDARACDDFHTRLQAIGVDISDDYYEDFRVGIDSCAIYQVNDEFPAIRRSTLDPAIGSVQYELSLHAIDGYRRLIFDQRAS